MGQLFDALERYFEDDDWHSERRDETTLEFRVDYGEGREWGCLALAIEDAEQFLFYSVLLERAPEDRRAELGEFVIRANYGLQVGNFELDLDDGEVRFKTSIDVEGTSLDHQLWRNLVDLNLMMMGVYYDGLMAVIGGDKTAAEAIAAIESRETSDA
ncbi:hypothetical protein ENSA5_09480 [Enhygromyxa salina]|uniref:YbjN domain-containing protein n=1 Tax=Enhygromyxa salina TaxID=215803 RepID=A0A2S9YGK4_9BACT|nr:YbjN domain-containing protein [Enhygromyxa salina]PRQ04238.1 hypothetical protein ENSA5_09480 [Enhygromyxa salina]